jgi:hypothetical protein
MKKQARAIYLEKMKPVRYIFLVILSAATLSCSLFLSPSGGRYNPHDPKNEIPAITLYPAVDGYVADSPAVDFDGTILWLNPSPAPISMALMRFDGAEFPENVVSAELHLWVTVAPSPATDILVYPVVKDWSPTTITWSTMTSGMFLDLTVGSSVTVQDGFYDGYVVLNVMEVYEAMIHSGNHGLYLETTNSAMNLHSSRGAHPPKLVLYGYDD